MSLFTSAYDAYKKANKEKAKMLICAHNWNSICSACYKAYVNGGKEIKMTMSIEKALKIINDLDARNKPVNSKEVNWLWLKRLEALGLIKFDESKTEVKHCISFNLDQFDNKELGAVKLEMWTEGLVLWVGGNIVWKSWEKYYKKGDAVTIEYIGVYKHKNTQAGIIK